MKRVALALIVLAVFLVACESASEKAREAAGKDKASATCTSTPAPVGAPSLPATFPAPADVTFTGSTTAGPSQIVTGYSSSKLTELYDAYKTALSQGGYTVSKSEKEDYDAEVNFSGNNSTGQVKLETECAGRTSIGITIRPSS